MYKEIFNYSIGSLFIKVYLKSYKLNKDLIIIDRYLLELTIIKYTSNIDLNFFQASEKILNDLEPFCYKVKIKKVNGDMVIFEN